MLSLGGCFERLAFVPSTGSPSQTPTDYGWPDWKNIYFKTEDGKKLHGWLIKGRHPANQQPKAILVHAHGNGGNIGNQMIPVLFQCLRCGCDVLMFDYRSYGLSDSGWLNRYNVVTDLAAAIKFARSKYPSLNLLLLGQSMGGATAALAMADKKLRSQVDGLCLVSAFADWNVIVKDALQNSIISWLFAYPLAYTLISPFRSEPKDGLATWPPGKPLLLIHGKADQVVPIHHLDIFLKNLPAETLEKVMVVRLEKGNHNELANTTEQEKAEVFSAIDKWVKSCVEQ